MFLTYSILQQDYFQERLKNRLKIWDIYFDLNKADNKFKVILMSYLKSRKIVMKIT